MTAGITRRVFSKLYALLDYEHNDTIVHILMAKRFNVSDLSFRQDYKMAVVAGMRFPTMNMESVIREALRQRHISYVDLVLKMRPGINKYHMLTYGAAQIGRIDLFERFAKLNPDMNALTAAESAITSDRPEMWQHIMDKYKPEAMLDIFAGCVSSEMFSYLRGALHTRGLDVSGDAIMKTFCKDGYIEAEAFKATVKLGCKQSLIDEAAAYMEFESLREIIIQGYHFNRDMMIQELADAVEVEDVDLIKACRPYITLDTFQTDVSFKIMPMLVLPGNSQYYFDRSVKAENLEFAKYFYRPGISTRAAVCYTVNQPVNVPLINWLKEVTDWREWPAAITADTSSTMVADIVLWVGKRQLSQIQLLPIAQQRIADWFRQIGLHVIV